MDDEADLDLRFSPAPPPLVSLNPFSHSVRRLSCYFLQPSRPVTTARPFSWVSLQGRLINSDEASSARAIKGGLLPDEAMAWELFSPIQRLLIVTVIGAAIAHFESEKDAQISRLQKSVEVRDQVLSSMQQKLDSLCEQLNNKTLELPQVDAFGSNNTKFIDCGCCLCDQHHEMFNKFVGNSAIKATDGDEILHYKTSLANLAEQEERRMSDLSDWASSVTSAAEIQMNSLAIEQDMYNLKKDCEDKDVIIKELTTLLHSSDLAGSKRISELEDIIRRKNTTITRLKKDVVILEQKVVSFARLRRPSFSSSESPSVQIPHLTDNLIYDMDSTTSHSSSDSDSSPMDRAQSLTVKTPENGAQSFESHSTILKSPAVKTPENSAQCFESHSTRKLKSMPPKPMGSMVRPKEKHPKSRPVSPFKDIISVSRKLETISSTRQRQLSASENPKRSRRLNLSADKDTTPNKRWV